MGHGGEGFGYVGAVNLRAIVSMSATITALLVVMLITCSATAAAAPSLSITVSADPVESIAAQLTAHGASAGERAEIVLSVKPSGGEACAANPSADHGQFLGEESGLNEVTLSRNHTFETAGSYLACAWLIGETESKVLAAGTATIAVRPPHIALALAVPSTVRPGQIFQISETAQTETRRSIYTYVLPVTGRGCPANASATSGTAGVMFVDWASIGDEWAVTGGPFTATANEQIAAVGAYVICAYVEYQSSANVPEAATSATFAVVKPPPPCVVPRLLPHTTLAAFERRLSAAHCRAGHVSRAFSSRHRRGEVIAVTPRPGTRRANGTTVTILVSRGRHAHH